MITLTWAQINRPPFGQALMTLNSNGKLDRVTAYRVGRICQTAAKEMEKCRDEEIKLREKYAVLSGEGKPMLDEQGFIKIDDKKFEDFNKEFQAMCEKNQVTIKVHKLDFNQLQGLSGFQLMAIEELVDNLPEEKED